MLMTQCRLTKDNRTEVAFIPSKYAVEGSYIRIKQNKVWSDGWLVAQAYNSLPDYLVKANSQEYKSHRKVTDI